MIYTIYKISIQNTEFIYVGSTNNINRRIKDHEYNVNNTDENRKTFKYKVYEKIRENGGWNNCVFEIIETINDNIKEKIIREQFWIEKISNLNSIKALSVLTKKERDCLYHKEHIEERKIYNQVNKEAISKSYKEYYNTNHEEMLERAKLYHHNNPEKAKERNAIIKLMPPILCECGETYTYKHKSRHLKSKKHLALLMSKTET